MAPLPQEQDHCTSITGISEKKAGDGVLSPEELVALASVAICIPDSDQKIAASSSEAASEGNVPGDTDIEEKYGDTVLSPEELVAAASSAIHSPDTNKQLEENSRLLLHGISLGEDDCAGAVLVRRRSSGAPPPLLPVHFDSHVQMPGAFRAGSSVFYDQENAEREDEEDAANENSIIVNNDINSNGEDRLSSSHSSAPVEATLVTDMEPTTTTEVVKAEPLLSQSSSTDSKERRRKRRRLGLLAVVLLTVFAASVIPSPIFQTKKNREASGKNETEVIVLRVESNDSASADPLEDEEPLSGIDLLASYDRITHHAAIFQWKVPRRCHLEPESTSWLDEPFVMLQCGAGFGSNSSLVLYEGQTYGAKCARREINEVGCETSNMASTTGSLPSDSYAVLVLFSCGTMRSDYNTNSTPTAQIRVERTDAFCETPSNPSLADDEDDIQIVLSLERICRSSDGFSTVRPSNVCRSDASDDEVADNFLYSLSDKACCRKSSPCRPSSNRAFCDVDFPAFSSVDELADIEECRFKSLEGREELFQDAASKTLEAVSDLPEFELVEALIPAP